MGRAPDFIGVGAQRSGTSWIYACLYDHTELCAPTKEIHFFSREGLWQRGRAWYERHFRACGPAAVAGEFSSSYLSSPDAPGRIAALYPHVKLLMSLRHPLERLTSSYLNDIAGGVVAADMSLADAIRSRRRYVEDGRYATHLKRYLEYFPRSQMLILIYDDALADPSEFIRRIYAFLGVDTTFRPAMLSRRVGAGRVPRSVRAERILTRGTWLLRSRLTRGLWWAAKRVGVGDALRRANTAVITRPILPSGERARLSALFADEITELERLLNRDLTAWRQ